MLKLSNLKVKCPSYVGSEIQNSKMMMKWDGHKLSLNHSSTSQLHTLKDFNFSLDIYIYIRLKY